MSLPKNRGQMSFFDAPVLLSDDFFKKDDPYPLFREKIFPALKRAQKKLDGLYCAENGRPAVDPVLVAGVTLLQFMEKAPDRKASREVRLNLGWKYALGLPIDYLGFHSTTLHNFRDRLIDSEEERAVFDALLDALSDENLVRKRSKQRLDSTHVLGCISSMSRLEVVRETLRLTLEALQVFGMHETIPEWKRFKEIYIESNVDWKEQDKEKLENKFIQAGQDVYKLLQWLKTQRKEIRENEKAKLLQRVFNEQYEFSGDKEESSLSSKRKLHQRKKRAENKTSDKEATTSEEASLSNDSIQDKTLCADSSKDGAPTTPRDEAKKHSDALATLKKLSTCPGHVVNPHDPDAQWSAKGPNGKKKWQGYKVQISETLADDHEPKKEGEPTDQFITEVTTTEAIASDIDGMQRILEAQEKWGFEPPSELIVDTGYVSDDTLYEQEQRKTELVGPARRSPTHYHGYRSDRFNVINNQGIAICPADKTSVHRCLIHDSNLGAEYYRYEWGVQCDTCEQQKQCNKRKDGRRELVVGKYHDLLQARRKEMKTDEFKKRMKQRAGVEGSISEMKRSYGLTRTRYKGMKKTTFANYTIGAACNANRWIRRLLWESQNSEEN